MKSLSLRFSEKFSPECGTIAEHQKLIDKNGYVYYGKMGNPVSDKNISIVLSEENPRILLVHSGKAKKYWAYVENITKTKPRYEEFPDYYHDIADHFKTWFKITKIEEAPYNVMSMCKVISSGTQLGLVSKHSMSPYFVIDYEE